MFQSAGVHSVVLVYSDGINIKRNVTYLQIIIVFCMLPKAGGDLVLFGVSPHVREF